MAQPFTIHIYLPDGDPDGVRFIYRTNWTGIGIAFPRGKWPDVKGRTELARAGVYILVGYKPQDDDEDLPTLYIGQGDSVRNRVDSHYQEKDFWDAGIVFVSASAFSSSGWLNRAHVTWLEYALIDRAVWAKRCHLDNDNIPKEATLTEPEKADTEAFLREILQVLPLVGLRALESPKPVAAPKATDADLSAKTDTGERDTVIVPAQPENFERVFLGENCWYAIRISGGMLKRIKFIAAYQALPVSAVTHYAPVERIEPYGESGKYKLVFSEKAKPVDQGQIPLGDVNPVFMMGSKYTSLAKLKAAHTLADLIGKN
jgi:hypothetical protein